MVTKMPKKVKTTSAVLKKRKTVLTTFDSCKQFIYNGNGFFGWHKIVNKFWNWPFFPQTQGFGLVLIWKTLKSFIQMCIYTVSKQTFINHSKQKICWINKSTGYYSCLKKIKRLSQTLRQFPFFLKIQTTTQSNNAKLTTKNTTTQSSGKTIIQDWIWQAQPIRCNMGGMATWVARPDVKCCSIIYVHAFNAKTAQSWICRTTRITSQPEICLTYLRW